jgi:glutathione S-transferase
MKLYVTSTSPYVRKVLVTAHELGLAHRIEPVTRRPSPLKADPVLSAVNPLNKIPALVLDDGTVLYDSPVICEYLQSLAPSVTVIPASGPDRFHVLRTQALADGILDASVLVFYERRDRPKAMQWADWLDGQTQKANAGLDALEREASRIHLGPTLDLGVIAMGVTLDWLSFRAPLGDIFATRPNLRALAEELARRPCMETTAPRE